MQIQQPLPVTKHLVEILYVNESKKTTRICLMEVPSANPVPRVGDEISIPETMEQKLGTPETIFRVVKRRFPIQPSGMSQSKLVLFVSSDIVE